MKLEDAHKYILLCANGVLEIESIFQKRFEGNFDRLMACVEDNIINDETIDWPAVERDYRESVRMKEGKEKNDE